MKKLLIQFLMIFSLLFVVSQSGMAGWDPNEKAELQRDAAEAMRKFKKNDSSLKTFFEQAAGYVVFPTVGKGGFG